MKPGTFVISGKWAVLYSTTTLFHQNILQVLSKDEYNFMEAGKDLSQAISGYIS